MIGVFLRLFLCHSFAASFKLGLHSVLLLVVGSFGAEVFFQRIVIVMVQVPFP